ncbi:MAG: CHAP domain-containing protein [Ruminococcaceae bacterium]|nr:CHAP domain-containing protein [Oscillospiraceae bacterium]
MTGSAPAAECPMPGLHGGARRFMSKSLEEVFTVKRKEGFTLVELLVVILCCAIVTAAAMTLLFTGVRVENAAVNTSQEQQNARILVRTVEDLCSSGKINRIEQSYTGWSVGTEAQGAFSPLLTYVASAQELRTGDGTNPDAVLLSGVRAASVGMEGDLLTLRIHTEERVLTSSVFCRTQVRETLGEGTAVSAPEAEQLLPTQPELPETVPAAEKRVDFLCALAGQYGSKGKILGSDMYFSQWYCGGSFPEGWGAATPWCACFVSWGMAQVDASAYAFAGVEAGKRHFEDEGRWYASGDRLPDPGDLIFFDWEGDGAADHVGAVLCVNDDPVNAGKKLVYTIEGNCYGKVSVRWFAQEDAFILGYVDWASAGEAQ